MAVLTGVIEFVVKGTVATTGSGAKAIYNVFHYTSGRFPLQDSKAAVGAAFVNTWNGIANALSSTFTGVECDARVLDDATDQYLPVFTPGNGVVTGARLPSDVSVALLLRTNLRGKSYRGGKRLGPIAAADVVGDELTAGAITAHWGAVAGFLTAILSGGSLVGSYAPCVVSRLHSQLAINPASIDGALVTAALLNKTVGTMRRRKEKTVR